MDNNDNESNNNNNNKKRVRNKPSYTQPFKKTQMIYGRGLQFPWFWLAENGRKA